MGMYSYVYTGIGVKIENVIGDKVDKEEFLDKYFNKRVTEDIELVYDCDGNDYLMIIMSLDESATESGIPAEIKEFDFDELEKIRHKFFMQINSLQLEAIPRTKIKLITGAFVR